MLFIISSCAVCCNDMNFVNLSASLKHSIMCFEAVNLIHAVIEIALWGRKILSNLDEDLTLLKEVKKNKTKFLKNILDKLPDDNGVKVD